MFACLVILTPAAARAQTWDAIGVESGDEAIDDATLTRVQEQLRDSGFTWVTRSGVMDENTMDALRRFQRSRGLRVTGRLDWPTRSALRGGAPATSPVGP
jgi:peptidoglycan hydrolase-like protein with peptidoglycan-binding domain